MRLARAAGFFPGAKAALDVRNGLKTHALRRLRGERRPQAASAEKYELLVLSEYRLVVRPLRINPELQHSPWAVEGARHLAVALQFADVTEVDQYSIVAARERHGKLHRHRLNFAFGGLPQRLVSRGDGLRHCFISLTTMLAG